MVWTLFAFAIGSITLSLPPDTEGSLVSILIHAKQQPVCKPMSVMLVMSTLFTDVLQQKGCHSRTITDLVQMLVKAVHDTIQTHQ